MTIWAMLQGRRTYVLAGLLVLAAVVLLATGHLTPATAFFLLVLATAGFPVTLRLAIERHHDEVLAELAGVAATGAALTAHNLTEAYKIGSLTVQQGVVLGREIEAEQPSAQGEAAKS